MSKYYYKNGKTHYKYKFTNKEFTKIRTQKNLLNKKQIAILKSCYLICPNCGESFDMKNPDCYCNVEKYFYITNNQLWFGSIDLTGE